jgi:periplasmic protein TonB
MANPHDNMPNRADQHSPLGRLRSTEADSRWASLLSNLGDFLAARPVKTAGAAAFFSALGFGAGVRDNLKEFFKPGPRGVVRSRLLVDKGAGFSGFWQNLRELFNPAQKLTPEETANAVPEIWSKNPRFGRVQLVSVAIHVAVIALLLSPLALMFHATTQPTPKNNEAVVAISDFHLTAPPAKVMTGGGSSHDKTPPSRGKAPKFAMMQLAAPTSHPVLNPKVSMPPTVLGPQVAMPNVNAANWGNPLTGLLGNSLGDKSGNGIGNGPGNGLGNGSDWGSGAVGHPAGYGGYGSPECLYCPNAQYSDEAVKAKYQGAVLVDALITPDGRATDVRVIKSLGLGLDENAVAAVRTWRFKPAKGPDGKPAAVEQTIEVEFRLI